MEEYKKSIEVRWSDLDPNFHMLHSKYYDLGAYCRMSFLVEHGLTQDLLKQNNIGPILFREECIFRKELKFGDRVWINVLLRSATQDFSRWSMVHEIRKNEDILSATIHVDGAWLDTIKRKLAVPVQEIRDVFEKAPRTPDFIFS